MSTQANRKSPRASFRLSRRRERTNHDVALRRVAWFCLLTFGFFILLGNALHGAFPHECGSSGTAATAPLVHSSSSSNVASSGVDDVDYECPICQFFSQCRATTLLLTAVVSFVVASQKIVASTLRRFSQTSAFVYAGRAPPRLNVVLL